jgi:hypothetical protein
MGGQAKERSGSWNNEARNARCAYRNRNNPDDRNNNLGFRALLQLSCVELLGRLAAAGGALRSARMPPLHGPAARAGGSWRGLFLAGPFRLACEGRAGGRANIV